MSYIGMTEEEARARLEASGATYRLERSMPPRGAAQCALWRVVRVRECPPSLTLCAFAPGIEIPPADAMLAKEVVQ